MDLLDTMKRQWAKMWTGLSPGHRIIMVLLFLVCAGLLVVILNWGGASDYHVLCGDLSAKECAQLVSDLQGEKIPARVNSDGSTVLVPSGRLERARMVAAEKGMPGRSGLGFDTFRDPKIGMTPFAEQVNYVNALQNELATTISSLDSILYARVHLVMPKRELFVREAAEPSASVLVVTRGDRPLPERNAVAIANLVASAVEGLASEEVTITDGRGNVVAGKSETGAQMAADDQLDYRREVEQYLSDKAETMLAKVLGFNRSEVRVSADLTFQDSRETSRQYDPDKRVIVSERIESTKSSGSWPEVGGPVGAGSGAQGQPAAGSGGNPTSSTTSENMEYVVSESVRETVNRGAEVRRLSVAAFVDIRGQANPDEEQPGGTEAAPTPSMDEIGEIIKEAVGLDESRGDKLKIVEARFTPTAMKVGGVSSRIPGWATKAAQYFAVGAVALVLLVMARRALKGMEQAGPRKVLIPEVIQQDGDAEYPAQFGRDELMRQEVGRFVEQDPELASRMIEGWIEGEGQPGRGS